MSNKFEWKYLGQNKVNLIRSLYVKSPSIASTSSKHFNERFIRKQSESFLSQPEQTIWVSRHRTLRNQYLHLGVFL